MTSGQSLRSYGRVNIVGRGMLDKPVITCGHSLIGTAYHEAGHALLAHLHGFRIMWVTIIPDARTLGRVRSMDWELDYVAANQPERLIWAVPHAVGTARGARSFIEHLLDRVGIRTASGGAGPLIVHQVGLMIAERPGPRF
jgi:hypothetical protein